MRGQAPRFGVLAVALCALLLPSVVEAASGPSSLQTNPAGQAFPNTSWALGIVVPEGAALQGGAKLSWEGAVNVTAAFTLPNITMPDRTVYAVLSVMTGDGSVLQAAAGIRANDALWLGYSWSIPGVQIPITYHWILNASAPAMAQGAAVSASIFRSTDGWYVRITDKATGSSAERPFPLGLSPSLKAGDQEVFSLESYSRSGPTFRDMGNLTLNEVLVDGRRVAGGVYPYSVWDPNRNPLFVVGSSGSSPPSFISFGQAKDGSFEWGYARVWGGGGRGEPFSAILEGIAMLSLACLSVLAAFLWRTMKPVAKASQK